MSDGRKKNGGAREGAGRKPGGRNKTTLLAMGLREQILGSSYSPLTIFQKNIEWTQGEAEKLEKALEPLDFAKMDAAKVEALNAARAQAMQLRKMANDFAAQAAPYVQPKPVPIDDPINIDIAAVVTAEDLVTANNNLVLAVANGEISPEEGVKVSAVLESRRKAIELLEMEKRIAALEAKKGIGR
jgi:hypothetical protein